MSSVSTAALVGATGGAGTTRTAVELATLLADRGEDVLVLDAAFATQGLADYVSGQIDPDLTHLLVDGVTTIPADALFDLAPAASGRAVCCPVAAPFERLARAKTADAARTFDQLVTGASARFDRVLIDTPPIAANQAVAAVTAAERVALVTPATTRGADAVQRMRARLLDLGTDADHVFATQGDLAVADVCLPPTAPTVAAAPAWPDDPAFARALIDTAETLFDCEVDVDDEADGLFSRFSNVRR